MSYIFKGQNDTVQMQWELPVWIYFVLLIYLELGSLRGKKSSRYALPADDKTQRPLASFPPKGPSSVTPSGPAWDFLRSLLSPNWPFCANLLFNSGNLCFWAGSMSFNELWGPTRDTKMVPWVRGRGGGTDRLEQSARGVGGSMRDRFLSPLVLWVSSSWDPYPPGKGVPPACLPAFTVRVCVSR